MNENYEVIPVTSYRELGMYLYRGKIFPTVKGLDIAKYIDYEAIGKDYAAKTQGQFNASGFMYEKSN